MISTLISFTFVIGILIFVHEFGHFIVAKKAGVEVEKFSLGFGPKLIGFQRGETYYKICAIPLGGYVKMKGENPDEPLSNDPKEFGSRSVGVRAAIVAAGSIMNFILPFFLLPLVFIIGIQVPTYLAKEPTVHWVSAGSPAEQAGIQSGDTITAINGEEINDWKELTFTLLTETQQGQQVTISLERNGVVKDIVLSCKPDGASIEPIGLFYEMNANVGGVLSDSPASGAGLQAGDRITKIAGTPITHWIQLSEMIEKYPGEEVAFTIERDGQEKSLTIKPEVRVAAVTPQSPAGKAGLQVGDTIMAINDYDISQWKHLLNTDGVSKQGQLTFTILRDGAEDTFSLLPQQGQNIGISLSGKIGIVPLEETVFKRYGIFASIREGFQEAIDMFFLTLKTLWKLITFNLSLKMLGGPIVIAKMTGTAAKSGIASLLVFTSLLSLNLSIINLLPIPVLDGGHLFFLLIELIMRKPLATKKMELVQKIGLALLILIFLTVTYNDILRTVPHKYLDFLPWK